MTVDSPHLWITVLETFFQLRKVIKNPPLQLEMY